MRMLMLDHGEIEAAIQRSGWIIRDKTAAREFHGLAVELAEALCKKNASDAERAP